MDLYNITIFAFPAVFTVVELASLGAIWKRRHHQPLKFRDPYLLLCAELFSYLMAMSTVLRVWGFKSTSCAHLELIFVPWILQKVFLASRLYKLLVASLITTARIHGDNNVFILRNTWLGSSRSIWIGIAVASTMYITIHACILIPGDKCHNDQLVRAIQYMSLISFWTSVAIMLWMLRNTKDCFFVISEFKLLLSVMLAGIITRILFIGFSPDTMERQMMFIITLGLLLNQCQVWYPFFKSFTLDDDADPNSVLPMLNAAPITTTATPDMNAENSRISISGYTALTREVEFLGILNLDEGYQAFKRFVTMEFSVENIICWTKLHRLELDDHDVSNAEFRAIFETFIAFGSPNEVNISSSLRKAFMDTLQAIDVASESAANATTDKRAVLKRLQDDLVLLMKVDSFARFRKRPEGRRLARLAQKTFLHIVTPCCNNDQP